MANNHSRLVLGIGCGWGGYQLFSLIGFPAAALTGAAAVTTVVALIGLKIVFPVWLRNAVILLLGINIGTAVTPDVISGAGQWPVSLSILLVCVIATIRASSRLLTVLFGFDRDAALLAAVPGHLSFVLSIAAERGSNLAAITILQTVRVLVVTLVVPVVVVHAFGATGISVLPHAVTGPLQLGAIVLVALPIAFVLARLRVPAAFLLSGMMISALGHGTDLTPGRLPDILAIAALVMMGTLIGSRFSQTRPRVLLSYLIPGLLVAMIAIGFAVLGLILTAMATGLPPGLLIIAFTPGGVEAMAAIAVALGYDPTFVAVHHVIRIGILAVIVPYLFGMERDI